MSTRVIEKYNGSRLTTSVRKPTYNRKTDLRVKRHDPVASPMNRFTGDVAKMYAIRLMLLMVVSHGLFWLHCLKRLFNRQLENSLLTLLVR